MEPTVTDDDRAGLVKLMAGVAQTRGGRFLLRGEPGLGKSRLLDEAVALARDAGVRVLYSRASEAAESLPYHGLVDFFGDIPDAEIAVLPPAQREALDAVLARRRPLHQVLPLTVHVAVTSLLTHLLGEGHVAIAVDDWTLLDIETMEILAYATSGPRAATAVSLLSTIRLPSPFDPQLPAAERPSPFSPADQRTLHPMAGTFLVEFIRKTVGSGVDEATVRQVAVLSAGNPLWAQELIRLRHRSRALIGPELHIPPSVMDLLSQRVESLPKAVSNVLASVSALGEASVDQVLATITGDERALDSAIEARVVLESHGRVRLFHPLLGKASMLALSRQEHRAVHARAAEASTTAIERARHLDLSILPGTDEETAEALSLAAREARSQGASKAARDWAEKALMRTGAQEDTFPSRAILVAETAFGQSDFQRVVGVLSSVGIESLDIGLLDRALPLLIDAVAGVIGEDEVFERLDALTRLAAGRQPQMAIIDAYRAEFESFDSDLRRAWAETAVDVLRDEIQAPVTLHRAAGALVLAKLDAGEGLDEVLLALCEKVESRIQLVALNDSATAQRGFYAHQVDDHATSRNSLWQVISQAEGLGEEFMAAFFSMHLSSVLIEMGDRAASGQMLQYFESHNPWLTGSPPSVLRARALLAMADGDEAQLRRILESPPGPGTPRVDRLVRLSIAGLFAARSEQWSAAIPLLEEARTLAANSGVFEPGRRLWVDLELGESYVAVNRLAEAQTILRHLQIIALGPRRDLARSRALRLASLIESASGRLESAEELLDESLSSLRGEGRTIERGRILLELGRLMRRRRLRGRARSQFLEGLELAEAGGDALLAARIRRELERFSTTADEGPLTPAEQRVADAVLSGASNSDIAASQFVSLRTVEAHLSSIYRKLEVKSRNQLVAKLLKDHGQASD